jgi:hypothetical protein
MTDKIGEMVLYAWVGEDELNNSHELGLKQGLVPAGLIPMVSVSKEKLDKYWTQAVVQAATYGKKIYLVKFTASEILNITKEGK